MVDACRRSGTNFTKSKSNIMDVEACSLLNVHILLIFIQSSLECIDGCRIHNLLRQTVPIVSDPLSLFSRTSSLHGSFYNVNVCPRKS